MTYVEAKRKARKELGPSGTAWEEPFSPLAFRFCIGVELPGQRMRVGVGASWDEAFKDAEERTKK